MKNKNVLYLIVGKPCWSPATSWRSAIWTTMSGVESKDVTKIEAANPIWRWKMEAFGYLTISWIADVQCRILPFCYTFQTWNERNRWMWSPKHWILIEQEHNNYKKILCESNDDIYYRLCLLTNGNSKEPVSDRRICVVPCPPQEFGSWHKKLGLQSFCFYN